MALMNAATQYKDPRAQTLYGGGNKKFTDQQIKDFINTPGRTDEDIMGRALKEGISTSQISNAMKGDKRFESSNVDKYLAGQGITKDVNDPVPTASAPERVAFDPIKVGANETVQGRMDGLLKDPNSTMNVQATTAGNQMANRKGLLNSSIAVSAAQDAAYKNAMPIATQDAATFYDAKKTNSVQDLNANMFNSDSGTRVNMFNAGNAKDLIQSREGNQIQRERNTLDRDIAQMDSDNKLAIANIQAMANDSGIMGDLGKNLMEMYQRTAADPNIAPELKTQIYNNLKSQYENITSLLPTFEKAGKKLTFGTPTVDGTTPAAGGADTGKKSDSGTLAGTLAGTTMQRSDGATATTGKDGKVGDLYSMAPNANGKGYTISMPGGRGQNIVPVPIDTSNFRLTADEEIRIKSFNAGNGYDRVEMSDVVPQEFMDYVQQRWDMGDRVPYDLLTVPISAPGSMRTDNQVYRIWKAAASKYQ